MCLIFCLDIELAFNLHNTKSIIRDATSVNNVKELTCVSLCSVVVLEHKRDKQVAVKAVVGGQRLDVALIFGEEAMEADLASLLIKVLSHHSCEIENLG